MTETVAQTAGPAAALGLNPTLFIAQLVNFLVVMLVVWRWIYRPLIKMMDERSKKIADGLTNAEAAKRELAGAEQQTVTMVKEARQEAQRLVDAARLEAERERQRLMAETQTELERQLAEAKDRLKREKEATISAVKQEMSDLVVAATKKVTSETVDADAHHGLVKQAIEELNQA